MWNTTIYDACSSGNVKAVEDFVMGDRSCLKQKHGFNKDTPFCHACSVGQLPVVEAILALKPDMNDAEVVGNALAFASARGHLAVVQLLLAVGINVNSG
jgi:ankyrin repeat protein